MESQWVCQRALLHLHPDWSQQQLADTVGCSKSMVNKWKKRFAEVDPENAVVQFSRSRAPHHHPARVSQQLVERIIEMRLSPPDHLKRTPGPKALLYYLPRDEALRLSGLRLPRSTRTVWKILDTAGLIERAEPRKRSPFPLVGLLEEVQVDFKDISSSPRIRSAPQSRFSFAISLIKAIVSTATFGL